MKGDKLGRQPRVKIMKGDKLGVTRRQQQPRAKS